MSNLRFVLAIIPVVVLVGCYHATIDTGLTPSTEVIHEPFASSWIYGLVPPNTILASTKCTNGVAKVETQHSFVNWLVGAITFGIYTPIEITVTCAAKGSAMIPSKGPDIVLRDGATNDEILRAFAKAADISVATRKPVYVEY